VAEIHGKIQETYPAQIRTNSKKRIFFPTNNKKPFIKVFRGVYGFLEKNMERWKADIGRCHLKRKRAEYEKKGRHKEGKCLKKERMRKEREENGKLNSKI
jgi:hypothetical protein